MLSQTGIAQELLLSYEVAQLNLGLLCSKIEILEYPLISAHASMENLCFIH